MPIVPVHDQYFSNLQDWVRYGRTCLTAHCEYSNTEHGEGEGWRGHHFTAMCFDQFGRRCRDGGDFQRAEADGAYPIWWIWPDQIVPLIMLYREAMEPAKKYRKRDGSEGVFHAWHFNATDTDKPGWLIDAIASNRACLRFGIPGEEPAVELYVDASGSTHPGRAYAKAKLGQWLVLRESGYVTVCSDEAFRADYIEIEEAA